MSLFRKKPIVIEARQFDNRVGTYELLGWINAEFAKLGSSATAVWESPSLFIPTLEGPMRADVGDWIIRGVSGEFYPCKPEIFQHTYEPVEPPMYLGSHEGPGEQGS